MTPEREGALAGIRVVELAGIGPAPFACMMLADHGAEVIRVERPGTPVDPTDILLRNRRRVSVDLKAESGMEFVRDLTASADAVVEGFRPGVMERLGLGPVELIAANPKLVYGRMTGWGQNGPFAAAAGHDINYISLAGALHAFGRAGDAPTPPANMVGDFGGGGMVLAFGMVSALLNARSTGRGQIVDCSMVDGAALLMSMIWSFRANGSWLDERGVNMLDTGAHFYDAYETSDGRYVSIGSIEPQFYALLKEKAGLGQGFDDQMDRTRWPAMKADLATILRQRTRDEWCALMEGSDVCFAPVLSLEEAPRHPHNRERGTFLEKGGVMQPAPAPRLSATPAREPRMAGGSTDAESLMSALGYSQDRMLQLIAERAVG